MIILLDSCIPSEKFTNILAHDDIKLTDPNSVVVFAFDKELMLYCMQNNISYGVDITNVTQAIYANNMDARYIFPKKEILKVSQNLADNYMFDSKIIAKINSEDEIEKFALLELDGVIFKDKINNVK